MDNYEKQLYKAIRKLKDARHHVKYRKLKEAQDKLNCHTP